jgi:aldose 1-epimerase
MQRNKNNTYMKSLDVPETAGFVIIFGRRSTMGGISKQHWRTLSSGEEIELYTLRNSKGIETTITNYGGRVVTLKTPDRAGRFCDVVLGFDLLDGYLQKNPYFGAIVGRYANRIANGEFKLDGQTYKLACNDGPNALHGGLKGFDKVVWGAAEISTNKQPALQLRYVSKDGEEGYPGNLTVAVVYALTDQDELRIDFDAITDKDTVVNLTNHSYFDLSGEASGNILDYEITIDADRFTPVNTNLIPTGELRKVDGTPFDFRKPAPIGSRIDEKDEQLQLGIGYDHNYVLNRSSDELLLAARVLDPKSGRVLEVLTTEPGVQFYSGNHLDGTVKGKGGVVYKFRSGFCLETQHFPDSPNHPEFPSTLLRPGQRYKSSTVFKFSVES